MLHHTRAVRRAVRRALIVADMPFGSYHGTVAEGLANAVRFVKEAGAEAVKIEGPRVELVRALTEARFRSWTPGADPAEHPPHGRYRVQARTAETASKLKADALALSDAGAGLVVLEGVPREVLRRSPPSCRFPPSALAPGRIAMARSSFSTTC